MRILLTNHHLNGNTGSEIYTYTLATALKKAGHNIVVYTKYLGSVAETLNQLGIYCTDSLNAIKHHKFDVAHVHHLPCALEVRQAYHMLPIVYQSHGSKSVLEKPPYIDINVSRYVAISELVKQSIASFHNSNIKIVRNGFDQSLFYSRKKINQRPKKALVISNRISGKKKRILDTALAMLSINTKYIGGKVSVSNNDVPQYINESDIVISLGRGVVEAMLCARAAFIYDITSADGMVTTQNYQSLKQSHFSGLTFNKEYTVEQIVSEIQEKYIPEDVLKLSEKVKEDFNINKTVEELTQIYEEVITLPKRKLPASTFLLIQQILSLIKIENRYTAQEHDQIINSKFYGVWKKYNQLKKFILN